MGLRGLPAFLRAVPTRLFRRPPHGGSQVEVSSSGQPDLRGLIRKLPTYLRTRALTHSSWVEKRGDSNERLEFLGDSVLGLAIASTLWERYPDGKEGDLARLKAFIVSRASCAEVAERLDIGSLMAEVGAEADPKQAAAVRNRTILGNALEALVGAVFLTFGFEQARKAVVGAFEEQIVYGATSYVDYKTDLQERLALKGRHPEYNLAAETGPPHARVFTSEVSVDGVVCGQGSGTTIKGSEQAAAEQALATLGRADAED
jgi:ribonuclease-3